MNDDVPQRAGEKRALLLLNLVIMLFPPIHLAFAGGSIGLALTYFMGSGVILILTMLRLRQGQASREE